MPSIFLWGLLKDLLSPEGAFKKLNQAFSLAQPLWETTFKIPWRFTQDLKTTELFLPVFAWPTCLALLLSLQNYRCTLTSPYSSHICFHFKQLVLERHLINHWDSKCDPWCTYRFQTWNPHLKMQCLPLPHWFQPLVAAGSLALLGIWGEFLHTLGESLLSWGKAFSLHIRNRFFAATKKIWVPAVGKTLSVWVHQKILGLPGH